METHHVVNINTKVNFVLEHNISSTRKTHSGFRERQFAGNTHVAYYTGFIWKVNKTKYMDEKFKTAVIPQYSPQHI